MSGETGVPLDASALLEVLERHRVQYVVVGGFAAELHGSVRRTADVDVVPRATADNLERLAAALREVQAKIRTEGSPEGLPFSPSGEAMVGMWPTRRSAGRSVAGGRVTGRRNQPVTPEGWAAMEEAKSLAAELHQVRQRQFGLAALRGGAACTG